MVSYAAVNVAFDDESPVVKYSRRESLQSVKSLTNSIAGIPMTNETENENTNFKTTIQGDVVVKVKNAYKKYGRNGPYILKDFKMTVEKGTM